METGTKVFGEVGDSEEKPRSLLARSGLHGERRFNSAHNICIYDYEYAKPPGVLSIPIFFGD